MRNASDLVAHIAHFIHLGASLTQVRGERSRPADFSISIALKLAPRSAKLVDPQALDEAQDGDRAGVLLPDCAVALPSGTSAG